LLEPCLEKQKAKVGPGHRDTLRSMDQLAQAYRADGQREKGLELLEKPWKSAPRRWGLTIPIR